MNTDRDRKLTTLGVVSFLNARPLIEGLDAEGGISLHYAVPARLPAMLRHGEVDAALIPAIDLARGRHPALGDQAWTRVSDAGIVADGESLTVRVFSRVPPEEMTALYVDEDSHTSIVLAQLFWSHWYERRLRMFPLSQVDDLHACESVLLIGDKVVNAPVTGYPFEVDLGGAWKAWQGVPFVFAAWAAPSARDLGWLARALGDARDRGVARAPGIAAEMGPPLGWPVELARDYLTRNMKYTITPEAEDGMQRFFDLAAADGIIPEAGALVR